AISSSKGSGEEDIDENHIRKVNFADDVESIYITPVTGLFLRVKQFSNEESTMFHKETLQFCMQTRTFPEF
uniref:Uncharacterized protein n=1 Tax=Romanomermis culicivorax TaxID=13658 RepID=A0A915IU91_ROMCU